MEKNMLIQQIEQGLSTWKIASLNNTTQPNIRYWLKKFNLQTHRTINQKDGNRKCLSCDILKPQNYFYKRGKKYMSHCKQCYQKTYSDKARIKKQKAVDYLGGKCLKCGYNKCLSALEFHHLDPKIKDVNPSQLMRFGSFEKLKSELDKCVLLCANCHREEHNLPTLFIAQHTN